MELTKENIEEWKKELDKLGKNLVKPYEKYSSLCTEKMWLDDYEGQEPQEVIDDDLYYSAQN